MSLPEIETFILEKIEEIMENQLTLASLPLPIPKTFVGQFGKVLNKSMFV
jgi:hypothetical protein